MKFWQRRPGLRRRRMLARGAGIADAAPVITAFVPPEIDVDGYRAQIEKDADSLTDSVDDVTGHVLHGRINAWADQQIASLVAEYSTHLAQFKTVEGEAEARATLSRQLWMEELTRLVETGIAVEATLAYLIDEARDEGDQAHGG